MPIIFPISYPPELPLSQKLSEIKQAIEQNQVVIIGGETGSGKTTQLPKICLDLGRGQAGMIAHTQPRRLAARSVSQRIADELNVKLGEEVGYQVRFNNLSSSATQIKLMTDGILLAEIQHDPLLSMYDTIIIDEAHERSLNIDFLLGYLKNILPQRPELKLIITSATIDLDKFSAHFNKAPVLEVSGRTFPVDIVYRPIAEAEEKELTDTIIGAIRELFVLERELGTKRGDILIFLSGEREIRDLALVLRKENFRNTEILPLYARLGNKEQNRVFQSHTGRRIVLATNVAETSITVPGITSVIDPGMARISRYSVRSKVQRLPIEAISQASANQRAGRCGRVAPGICVRLYSEDDFLSRPAFTDTEITRTNLASVILQMHALGLGDIEEFPFLDKPESKAVSDGVKLLQELGAINDKQELTKAGRLMSRMPVDPRLGRMLLEASTLGCLSEVLVIVSAMSIQDPRERPMDHQQAADEKQGIFKHPQSDFLSFIKLWQSFEEVRQQMTQNQLRKYCQQHFLSYLRMREWREIHRQLHLQCRELGLKENAQPAGEDDIHRSLLSGLISQVARYQEELMYLGTRNRKFQIFPGSSLFRKKSKWILAAELVETNKLYARLTAQIKPEWIEVAAGNLLNHEYFEPHWEKRRGEVMAFEKISLYGLTLVEKRKLSFSKIDPVLCRELFIREALVAMQLNSKVGFYVKNCELIEKVMQLEEKTRRRDILIDEESLVEFYDRLLPEHIYNSRNLERWYRQLSNKESDALLLSEQDLIRDDSTPGNIDEYPDQLKTSFMALDLAYEFSPGKAADGISVDVPVSALKQLKDEDLDWLVPGMLREKCIALIKALPKQERKLFVPVPDVVDQILPSLKSVTAGNLRFLLARNLSARAGKPIDPQHWENYQLESHLQMHIRVLDDNGTVLDSGRDLKALQDKFSEQIQRSIQRYAEDGVERSGITHWDFQELPLIHEIKHGSISLQTYPALVDEGDSVSLTLCDNAPLAEQESLWGVVRLLMLTSPQQVKYLKKHLLQDKQKNLLMSHFGAQSEVQEQLIRAAYRNCFLGVKAIPRTQADFEKRFEECRGDLVEVAERAEKELYQILQNHHQLQKQLKSFTGLRDRHLYQDIQTQLDELLHADFISDTPREYFSEIPRYLKAIMERLEKYPRQIEKDKRSSEVLQYYYSQYTQQYNLLLKQNSVSLELERFRWLMEEYRVSLYAQTLGTREPVSEKRLKKFWQEQILATSI
tara:strand:+ start:242332 stop:246048 length:3717 start_codon:yes stop_codon:yes gene_type:complete